MKSNFTQTAVEIPKLTTFEQLLETIDDETKDNKNNTNNNKNKDCSVTTSNTYKKMNTNSDHKENDDNKRDNSDVSIKTIQDYIGKMNESIEKCLIDERKKIFCALFDSGLMGFYYDKYLMGNSIVKLLKNCFLCHGSVTRNELLSVQSEINLKCVQLVLDNKDVLFGLLSDLLTTKEHDLEKYLEEYQHRCKDKSKYFNSSIGINTTEDEFGYVIFDVLRNLLFQVGVICFIIQSIDDKNENERYGKNESCYQKRRKILHRTEPQDIGNIYQIFEKCLHLHLVDPIILVNDVSLYHVFAKYNNIDFLKTLLFYVDVDWSIVKDGKKQVEE